jgi:hypothetical protein
LEVTPGFLLGGIVWTPHQPPCVATARRGGARGHDAHSLDSTIRRLWRDGRRTGEIADALGTSSGTVSAIVHRLREHGEELEYRCAPTRAVHEGARHRRGRRLRAPCSDGDPVVTVEEKNHTAGRPPVRREDWSARIAHEPDQSNRTKKPR